MDTTDVAIVGSGIAGALVAYELARRGVRVVVFEAGPRITRADIVQAHTRTHHHDMSAAYPSTTLAPRPDWNKPDAPYLLNDGAHSLRCEYLRVVGGTTWHWAARAQRMRPADLELHSRYGLGTDWPITYADLEPYYAQAERELGVSCDDAADQGAPRASRYPMPSTAASYLDRVITARLRSHGFDFVPRPSARNSRPYDGRPACHGYNNCMPICPIGAQYAGMVHVEKAEARGARVIDEALVTRLDVGENGSIGRVFYLRPDGSGHWLGARAFVLAANGIETPRLMLASAAARAPSGVGNAFDTVGRYLMDHPGISVRMLLGTPIFSGRGPQASRGCDGYAHGAFRRGRAGYDITLDNKLELHAIATELLEEKLQPPRLDRELRYRASREVKFSAMAELLPEAENRVRLDTTRRDSAGVPLARLTYRVDGYTERALAHAKATLGDMARALGATRVHESGVYSTHHLMGTARMGADPRASVVDRHCRAHQHGNLYIAGSSVFPTGGTVSPTLTIAALALRTSNTLAAELQSGAL